MEWALDTEQKVFDGKTEAEFLTSSVKDVMDHYGSVIDQKTLDWFNLAQCLLIVYGGRIYAIRSNPKVKPQRAPNVQETAQMHAPPRTHVRPDPPSHMNGDPASSAEIAGIGTVELPDDHPLSPNFKPRMN